MIQTLEDLVSLSNREADKTAAEGFPELAEEARLPTPGCTDEEINRIREGLAAIPESYLRVAAQVGLPNVSIGYLVLAPGRKQDGSLSERLTHANSSAWPLWKDVDHRNLYHVADYEADMICVVREGQPNAGEVVRLDLSCPPTAALHRTAWSFEQLLLGFGRLREQHLNECLGQGAIDEVLASLVNDFEFDYEQMEDWTWFAEIALGEGEDDLDEEFDRSGPQDNAIDCVEPMPRLVPPLIEPKRADRDDLDTDIVSEVQRPRPDGFDSFSAIPTWPDWQIDNFVERHDGSQFRSYWTRFEGQVYQLAQWPRLNLDPSHELYAVMAPRVRLAVVKGTPKPWNPDWDLRKVADFPLPGIEPWKEAREEVAAYRRCLPELLAEASAKKKK